jgi:serine acetyltransferase
LAHAGTGVVIHATTTIEPDVVIWQDVLIASQTDKAIPGAGRDHGVIVGAGTVIGARAIVLCPAGRTLRIGRGARIGAGAVVIDDVPDGGVIGAAPSPLLRIEEQG